MSNSGELTKALRQIVAQPTTQDVDRPQPRGAASRVISVATPVAPKASEGGGGGIASPLVEADISSREYWPGGWTTTDGLFVFPAIKEINMIDANGDPVVLQFAEPA